MSMRSDFEQWYALTINVTRDQSAEERRAAFESAMNPQVISVEEIYREWAGVELPKGENTLNKWRAFWLAIKDWVSDGYNASDVLKKMARYSTYDQFDVRSTKTVNKIIKAGNAGFLD